MSLADRIKECRKNSGLSQSELADRLVVSRQAVTKWESGKGTPDIGNLKNMANLFGVSVDYLLDDDSAATLGEAVLRQPIDVDSLDPTGGKGPFKGAKVHTAVRSVFPKATIWPLSRMKKNTKSQTSLEWLNALVFDGPFNLFGAADSVSNREAYYLVEEKNRQLLARVSKEAVESRELNDRVTTTSFVVGMDKFRRQRRPL